jgi:hypothetical protein
MMLGPTQKDGGIDGGEGSTQFMVIESMSTKVG